MECFCGCGAKLGRDQDDANLQAAWLAFELLAWDKARAAGQLGSPPPDDVERLIERGADCYRGLILALHGGTATERSQEGQAWLGRSEAERQKRPYMTRRGRSLFPGNTLPLAEEDYDRLDRAHPERSFSGGAQPAQPADAGNEILGKLERLRDLHREGALTDEEFAAVKARIIDRDYIDRD